MSLQGETEVIDDRDRLLQEIVDTEKENKDKIWFLFNSIGRNMELVEKATKILYNCIYVGVIL